MMFPFPKDTNLVLDIPTEADVFSVNVVREEAIPKAYLDVLKIAVGIFFCRVRFSRLYLNYYTKTEIKLLYSVIYMRYKYLIQKFVYINIGIILFTKLQQIIQI